MNELKNKVAIVTGGTKGIGLEIVKLFSEEGAYVIACARNEVDLSNYPNVVFHKLDVTNSDSCKELVDFVMEKYGKIDILVGNAGITKDSMTHKMSEEDFDNVINTNLKGIFNITKLVGPLMVEQGSGSIINISSIVGEYGNIGQANYAASKAGIIGMSKSWAKEFSRKGLPVRVNVVCPGYILTDMVKTVPQELLNKFAEQTMLKRLGEPREIAQVVMFLASNRSSYITGTVIDANGGMRL